MEGMIFGRKLGRNGVLKLVVGDNDEAVGVAEGNVACGHWKEVFSKMGIEILEERRFSKRDVEISSVGYCGHSLVNILLEKF